MTDKTRRVIYHRKLYPEAEPTRYCVADPDELVVVDGKAVKASFLSSVMRLGKVEGADRVRKLNRAERRRFRKTVEAT